MEPQYIVRSNKMAIKHYDYSVGDIGRGSGIFLLSPSLSGALEPGACARSG